MPTASKTADSSKFDPARNGLEKDTKGPGPMGASNK